MTNEKEVLSDVFPFPCLILNESTHTIVDANPVFLTLFEASRDDLIGKKPQEIGYLTSIEEDKLWDEHNKSSFSQLVLRPRGIPWQALALTSNYLKEKEWLRCALFVDAVSVRDAIIENTEAKEIMLRIDNMSAELQEIAARTELMMNALVKLRTEMSDVDGEQSAAYYRAAV